MEERGRRLRSIREALGLSQYDIAPLLNQAAEQLGFPANYRYYTVSRNEAGTISFEDAAVWLAIDPAHHSLDWIVYGDRTPAEATRARRTPAKAAHPDTFVAVPPPARRTEHRRKRSG